MTVVRACMTLVLYRRRALTSVVARKAVLGRAFDKAVRRKPLAFAAAASGRRKCSGVFLVRPSDGQP